MEIKDFIRQQPSTLEAMLSSQNRFRTLGSELIEGCDRILLVGTGSSMNAILASKFQFSQLGCRVSCASPMTVVDDSDQHGSETVAIILSQSGQSKDAIEAVDKLLASRCRVVVVTGDEASTIAELYHRRVILPVADEKVGPKTKGYFASVLGLYLLAKALNNSWPQVDNKQVVATLYDWIDKCDVWAQKMAADVAEADVLAVLGQGSQVGTASEGSLKIAEMSGIPAFGEETEEMSHGRFHGLTSNSHVFFITDNTTQTEFARRLSSALTRFNIASRVIDMNGVICENALKGPPLPDGPLWKALFAVVPFQWLAVHAAIARGVVPEKMRYPDMGKYLGLKHQVPA